MYGSHDIQNSIGELVGQFLIELNFDENITTIQSKKLTIRLLLQIN